MKPEPDPPLRHRTRPIRCLGLQRSAGWSYKYSVAGIGAEVDRGNPAAPWYKAPSVW